MATIHVSNAPRGCGTLKKKGVYAMAEVSEDGVLPAWTWLLSEAWDGGAVFDASKCPARGQIEINPQASLAGFHLWTQDDHGWEAHEWDVAMPQFGIADHVGAQFYTPYSFARECGTRGPSRRLRPKDAKRWAKLVPFPIFFCTGEYPVWESQEHAEFWLSAEILANSAGASVDLDLDEWDWSPIWMREGFTAYAIGAARLPIQHPMIEVFDALRDREPKTPAPENQIEGLFGMSWITHVVQVVDSEDEADPDLIDAGLDIGIIKKGENNAEANAA